VTVCRHRSSKAKDPLGQERLGDPVGAGAFPDDELVLCQRVEGALDARCAREAVTAAEVLAGRGDERLGGEGLEHRPLHPRRLVPDQREVRVLRPQHAREPRIELGGARPAAGRGLLPQRVAQLLRGVGVAARDRQHAVDGGVVDPAARRLEPLANEGREVFGRDHAELHLLRAAPERLVGVVEEPVHDAALAAQVDMSDVRLSLEDGPHQPW
jgi:hypothetical protein